MRRRELLALIAAAAAAPPLVVPGLALADDQRVALSKAFPMLEAYLGVPPGERSRFYLAYRATRDKRPVSDVKASIVGAGGAAIPLAFDRAGFLTTRLPSLAELKGPGQFVIAGQPFKLAAEARCAIAPSTRIDAAELAAALVQANAAIAKAAGPAAMLIPKMTAAYFPDAGGGRDVLADGRESPLPVVNVPTIGPIAYFEPAKTVGAKAVVFAKAPSRVLIGGHPKGA
ncbi:MAG TPA: hypothetical protein VN694_16870 [Caulobacteraceae bacterium]|nr:hypothetical protein [Caulobacteraceae bacterium]